MGDRLILQGDLEMREELQMRTALILREEVRWSRNWKVKSLQIEVSVLKTKFSSVKLLIKMAIKDE